jgi:hypothetical protein
VVFFAFVERLKPKEISMTFTVKQCFHQPYPGPGL